MTSRDTLGLLGARLLDLNALTPDDAADMLDRALRVTHPGDTRVTDHPADAVRIARLCGGLPLALRIIAALLSENPASAAGSDGRRPGRRAHPPGRAQLRRYRGPRRVRPVLPASRSDRARLFRLLTINPGPEISTQATAALADVDQPAARRGLEALARAHLIDHGQQLRTAGGCMTCCACTPGSSLMPTPRPTAASRPVTGCWATTWT